MRKILSVLFIAILLVSCAKKIPPAEPFDAEKSFKLANELLKKKKYEEARRELYDIKRREAELKYAPLAQLRLADSYIDEEEPELAIKEYEGFLDDYPGHSYAPYALYQIAMVYYEQIKDASRSYGAASRALEEFRKLNDIYPRNPYREDIGPKIEKCEEIVSEHEYLVGEFYFKREAWQGAIDRLTRLLDRFPDSKREADALHRVAVSYSALGNSAKANEYRAMLDAKYPGSMAAIEAKKAVESFAAIPPEKK